MKKNYEKPQLEVLEMELESIICASGDGIDISDILDGGDA